MIKHLSFGREKKTVVVRLKCFIICQCYQFSFGAKSLKVIKCQ